MIDPVQRVRELCLALPEATERLSHGGPAFFVRGRTQFVSIADHHHGDEHLALWCAAAPGVQQELIAENPAVFFRPPYVGHRGWLGVRLDVPEADWGEVGEIVRDAFRQVAPATLVARLSQ